MDPEETKRIQDLLNRIGQGDDKAAEELYRAHHAYLRNFVRHHPKYSPPTEADVEEVVQDAFLAVCKNPSGFRGQSSFKSYLSQIALNKAVDWARKNKPKNRPQFQSLDERQQDEEPAEGAAGNIPDEAWNLPELLYAKQRAKALSDCWTKLPKKQADAVFWVMLQGESVEQAAQHLGVPAGTVKSQLFSARKNLLKCLKAKLGGHGHA